MRDIDEVERCGADKILEPRRCADVVGQMRQQRMRPRLVESYFVFRRRIDVDHHNVPPIGRSAVGRLEQCCSEAAIAKSGSSQSLRQALNFHVAGGYCRRNLFGRK